jgi:DNA-directed RNA polymerase subunit RPC12/RpoP
MGYALIPRPVVLVPEIVRDGMPWKCMDCGAKFSGPKDRTPAAGCAVCGSARIFDCNVEYIGDANTKGREPWTS